jgi:hypothetical protein
VSVNLKQDRQGVRTPSDIERKYNLGDISAVADVAAAAQRAATNAQSVASDANAMAIQANATAKEASNAASEAIESAEAAQEAVTDLGGNVYTKDQTLSDAVREQLGLDEGATPNDAFAALGMASGGESAHYTAGDNIKIDGNVISVITTDAAEQDNTIPITSAGVYTQIGNINVLLSTI